MTNPSNNNNNGHIYKTTTMTMMLASSTSEGSTSEAAAKHVPPMTFQEVMTKAAKSAARGGTAGAIAMGANVACLMWMRTTVRL
jgi:hypothetical protein